MRCDVRFGDIGRHWAIQGVVGRYKPTLGDIRRHWATQGVIGRYKLTLVDIRRLYLSMYSLCSLLYSLCFPCNPYVLPVLTHVFSLFSIVYSLCFPCNLQCFVHHDFPVFPMSFTVFPVFSSISLMFSRYSLRLLMFILCFPCYQNVFQVFLMFSTVFLVFSRYSLSFLLYPLCFLLYSLYFSYIHSNFRRANLAPKKGPKLWPSAGSLLMGPFGHCWMRANFRSIFGSINILYNINKNF